MKNLVLISSLALALPASALAGSKVSYYSDDTVLETPAPCYQSGELVVKSFYDIAFIDSAPDGHFKDDTLHGGGLAVDYFFTETLGLGVEGYWLDNSSVQHSYNVNLTLRAPLGSDCLSVYAIGGGGVFTNGSTVGSAHVGGGIEYRFTDSVGVFADGRYKWIDGDEITLTSVRLGLSLVF